MPETTIKLEPETKVKEKMYELFIGESKAVGMMTDDLNGFLECIFIDTDKPIDLLISYEQYDNVIIFKSTKGILSGQKMFVPRILATHNDDEVINYSSEKFVLNNKLRIEAYGQPNTTVKILLRYT